MILISFVLVFNDMAYLVSMVIFELGQLVMVCFVSQPVEHLALMLHNNIWKLASW
jgi:hypothetical protein